MKSITRRVSFSAISLVLLVFSMALLVNYFFFTFQAEKTNARSLREKVSHICESLVVPLMGGDIRTAFNIGNNFIADSEVGHLRIFVAGRDAPIYDVVKFTSPDALVERRDVVYDGAVIGTVEMGVLMEEYAQTVRVMFWYGLLVAVIVSATLAIGLHTFIHAYLEEPLETLEGWAEKVAVGDYDADVDPIDVRELRGVAEKFGRMAREVRRREALLADSEKKYRELTELLPQVVFEIDREGRLTYCNRFGMVLLELDEEKLAAGVSLIDLMTPEVRERARLNMVNRLAGASIANNEYTIATPSGRTIPVLIYSALIGSEGGVSGLRGIIVDNSERKKMEEQLVNSQKMEAVGTLASGIAHDFNNLLQMISGYSEYLLHSRNRDQEDRAGINRIREAAMMAGSLVQRILNFNTKRDPERSSVDLNLLVRRAAEMLGRTLPKSIRIEEVLSAGLRPARADASQLDQVILNLALNARDAMPRGGTLTITTANETPDAAFCAANDIMPGSYVVLRVADTGTGMSKETAERIFEPFFTTKEVGKGTGLGLSSVIGIAKTHGGAVVCESALGVGSTFTVYIPEADEPEAAVEPPPQAADPARAGGESGRILVVDDEEIVRELAFSMLSRRGFEVTQAIDGESALAIYRERFSFGPSPFDLVLMDMEMPGMGGRKLMEELVALDPTVKVLVATGYGDSPNAKAMVGMGALGILAKPYRLSALVERIRELLARG